MVVLLIEPPVAASCGGERQGLLVIQTRRPGASHRRYADGVVSKQFVLVAVILAIAAGVLGNVTAHLLSGTQHLDPKVAQAIRQGDTNAAQQAAYDGPQLVAYEPAMTFLPPLAVAAGSVLLAAHRRGRRTGR
jgi:hypothetical protein